MHSARLTIMETVQQPVGILHRLRGEPRGTSRLGLKWLWKAAGSVFVGWGLVGLGLAACATAQNPPATYAPADLPPRQDRGNGSAAAPSARPPEDAATREDDATFCARAHPGHPPACIWEAVILPPPPHGDDREPLRRAEQPTCICHDCREDTDCTAAPEGRCTSGVVAVEPMRRVCDYSSDPCAVCPDRCGTFTDRESGEDYLLCLPENNLVP